VCPCGACNELDFKHEEGICGGFHKMGEPAKRLTDEELADVAARVLDGRCVVCRNEGNVAGRSICAACDGTGVFALSTDTMQSVLAELRERRALDLSDEDRDVLDLAAVAVRNYRDLYGMTDQCDACLAILDRLLGAKP
jgi:RecJ-like exonuclease